MRNLKLLATVLPVALSLASCNKQTEVLPTPAVGEGVTELKVEHGMLHFATQQAYAEHTDDLSDDQRAEFVRKFRGFAEFTSAAERLESSQREEDPELLEMIDSEYFKELLNENLAIWIEDHIYRVNPIDEKVYVIEASKYDSKYDDLLAQNISDEDVKAYSTDLNVLDEVKNHEDPQYLGCSQSAIGGREVSRQTSVASGQPVRTAISRYNKYGFYFNLYCRVESVTVNNPPPYKFDFSGSMWAGAPHIYYHKRCSNTVDYATTSTGAVTGGNQQFSSYQGSTALNEVYFYVKIWSNTTPSIQLTEQFGFRVNI